MSPKKTITEQLYDLLETSLDAGIKEIEYWEMTPAEISRYIESRNRVKKIEAQEKATFDYILADLIARGFAISMGSKQPFPKISQAYPQIFDELQEEHEKKVQEHKMNISVLRFKQFAQSHNDSFKKTGGANS